MTMNPQKRRIAGFLLITMAAFFVLAVRLAWLQLGEGTELRDRALAQLVDVKKLQSPRGTIYDRNGRELAVSSPVKSLYADPTEVEDADGAAAQLAPLLGMKPEEIKQCLTRKGRFVWLKRMLEPSQADAIAALHIKGLHFEEESRRYYPNDTLAAQVLGFVGTDDVGLNGLEMVLDKEIKGQRAAQAFRTDNKGNPIFSSVLQLVPRREGKTVYTTIDINIQFIAERSLDKAIATTKAKGGAVIVMNPRTGEILAMASRPTYDPNRFYDFSADTWRNNAVSTLYEPGSTFKIIVAAAALQEHVVKPDEHFYDAGYVEVSGRRLRNWDGAKHGDVTFADIIKDSLNTGFIQVGMRLGKERLDRYVRLFGFGQPTGIELPGEESGILFKPEDMRDSDLATMSIGQSIAVTPLQLITAVSAVANDGVLLKPHIIKEIRNPDGSVAKTVEPEAVRQVISPETAQELTTLLQRVVEGGSGKLARVPGYHFAGKTGTAQKLSESGYGYAEGQYIASFVGFGPVEDPQVAALVVLYQPQGVYYGGETAAPVFSEIMSQVVRYLGIRPTVPEQVALPAAPPASAPPRSAVASAMPVVPPGKVLVPDVRGKTIREAGETLAQCGLGFAPRGSGVAVRQSVLPYSIVDPGTEVQVEFQLP